MTILTLTTRDTRYLLSLLATISSGLYVNEPPIAHARATPTVRPD